MSPADPEVHADEQTGKAGDKEQIHISAGEARGGEIVLRSRRRRAIFIAGLAALVALAAIGIGWG